jgi:hypothetical protein
MSARGKAAKPPASARLFSDRRPADGERVAAGEEDIPKDALSNRFAPKKQS